MLLRCVAFLSAIGPLSARTHVDWDAREEQPVLLHRPRCGGCTSPHSSTRCSKDGDSIGAEVTVVAEGVPVGWGEPVFDKLDADLAGALMSINAVKAVAIGDGFDVVTPARYRAP